MRNYLTNRNNKLGFGFFDDVFENFFTPSFYSVRESMKTDIKETDAGYELAIDLPGYDKNDINLSLNNGYLSIEARREEKEEDKDSYVRRERSFSCTRSYYVGDTVTEEDIKAKYENGTLMLSVPKKDKKEIPPRKIQID